MGYPVFASGDVLNASDMNAVGMWLVKTQTVGSGVSSVTVTGAFSADYSNYLIVFNGIAATSGYSTFMTINGSTGSTYNSAGRYAPFNAGDANFATGAVNSGFWLGIMGPNFSGTITLLQPFATAQTNAIIHTTTTGYYNNVGGCDTNAASSTSFTLVPAFGTYTGGTIRVYGLRN